VRRTAEQYGVEWTTSYEAVLARKDVDMVQICTPDPLHCEQTVLAARTGKHVLCQKPIACSLDELRRMRQAVKESGIYFQAAQNMRWTARSMRMKGLIDQGAIGDVAQVTISTKGRFYSYPANSIYRQPGGPHQFLHNGVHMVDLASWLTRSLPVEVYGQSTRHYPADNKLPCDNFTVTNIRFASGAFGLVEQNQMMIEPEGFPPRERVFIAGTKGNLLAGDREGFTVESFRGGRVTMEAPSNADAVASFARLIGDFARRILDGKPPDIPIEHSMATVAACLLAVESAESGSPMKVEVNA
jgi:predicted dehydrogenase